MRQPKYLSPTSLGKFEDDRAEFFRCELTKVGFLAVKVHRKGLDNLVLAVSCNVYSRHFSLPERLPLFKLLLFSIRQFHLCDSAFFEQDNITNEKVL